MIPTKIKQITLCIALLGQLAVPSVEAANLGRIHVKSALGQPLVAELEINNTYAGELEGMTARLAPPAVFQQAEIPFTSALQNLRFAVEKSPHPIIRVTTDRPVTEPFLDFLVELTWSSGKLVREYTFLLAPKDNSRPTAPPVTAVETVVTAPAEAVKATPQLPQATPTDPATSSEWEVKRGESLAGIATKAMANGDANTVDVSLDRMLVALYKRNQDAFIKQNMNRLKAGAVLTIPDSATISATPAKEARHIVLAHAEDWNAYRKKLAASATLSQSGGESSASQNIAGNITAAVSEKVPETDPKDMVKVSGSEPTKQGPSEEDLIARDKALMDANSRIADLEHNIAELQKLIATQNQSLAALQQLAAANPPAPPPEKEVESEEDPEPPTFLEKLTNFLTKPAVIIAALLAFVGSLIFLVIQIIRSRRQENEHDDSPRPVLAPIMDEPDDIFVPTPAFNFKTVDLDLSKEEEGSAEQAPPPEAPPTPAPQPVPEPTPEPIPEPEPEPEVEKDVEEATTKLLLANAYVEMGDVYGAQQLLKEVLAEGSTSQREQAQSLLATLGGDIEEPQPVEQTKIPEETYTAEDFDQLDNLFTETDNTADVAPDDSTEETLENLVPEDGEVSPDPELAFDEEAFPYEEDEQDAAAEMESSTEDDNTGIDENAISDADFEEASFDLNEEPEETIEPVEATSGEPSGEETWETIEDFDIPSNADETIELKNTETAESALDGNDEVSTKLDLVQAYIDMGDLEGARDLLGEVLDEGNETQKAEAHRLMESLAGQ